MVTVLGLALAFAAQKPAIEWVPAIKSRSEFDRLARRTDVPYEMSHVRFLIDRRKNDRIYYIDSKQDRHHRDFANQMYLSLESEKEFFTNNSQREDRRFLLGWVAYQPAVKKWSYEFWDGDPLSADLIRLTERVVSKSFFAAVAFKPNSLRQEQISASLGLPRVFVRDIVRNQSYQPLNLGFAIGRLKIVDKPEEVQDATPEDILVLRETPAGAPPVAGLIFAQPTTPLSHLGLLARGWKIPSSTIADAVEKLSSWQGQLVAYRAERGRYYLRAAEPAEIAEWRARRAKTGKLVTPKLNLTTIRFASLSEQRAKDVTSYGAKSANLGEVMAARLPDVQVPKGFTLPFSAYTAFVKRNAIGKEIEDALSSPDLRKDGPSRRKRLEAIRARFDEGTIAVDTAAEILGLARREFGDKGVFVRSSTNSEDLPNFSGAGLYTTVPNVKGEQPLLDAIRKVWGSVWNDEAFLARERAGIDHRGVAMAVLIQEGVPSESSGVLITANPFSEVEKGTVYISAKRGLGIRVVDGKRVPEQILFRSSGNSVQVLTRSEEDSLLKFDPNGGVVEVPTPSRQEVLTDPLIRQLAKTGKALEKLFGKSQDVEWAVVGKQVYILQSRPYLRS